MGTQGVKKDHPSLLRTSLKTLQPTWKKWKKRSGMEPTTLKEIIRVCWPRVVSSRAPNSKKSRCTKKWSKHAVAVEWWASTRVTTIYSAMKMTERMKKTRMLWTFRTLTVATMTTWRSTSSINSRWLPRRMADNIQAKVVTRGPFLSNPASNLFRCIHIFNSKWCSNRKSLCNSSMRNRRAPDTW